MAHARDIPASALAAAATPVYVRFEILDLRERGILRVHIAGLVAGAEYETSVLLSHGSSAILDESRSVAAEPASDEGIFTLEYSVLLPRDVASPLPLSFELFQNKALLAVAKRNIVVSHDSARARCNPSDLNIKTEEVVGKKRCRPDDVENETPKTAKKPVNRQADVLKCIMDEPVTERVILERCGDNRYTREILRRLVALASVERFGQGGAGDPFRYRFLCTPEEALRKGNVDPQVSIRMARIEEKIAALLSTHEGFVTEKEIRSVVGDNTGTGKALRNLVKTSRVARAGRGGLGNPYTYKIMEQHIEHGPDVAQARAAHSDCNSSSDDETQVAQTLALLAAGHSKHHDCCVESATEDRQVASILESYMAAAAALEAGA